MLSVTWTLPAIMLLLVFLLKLFLDRSANTADIVQGVLELPVEISFLSVSFIAAFILSKAGNVDGGLLCFISYIVISIVVIVLWRRSNRAFLEDKLVRSSIMAVVNYGASLAILVQAIRLLSIQ